MSLNKEKEKKQVNMSVCQESLPILRRKQKNKQN